MPDANRYQGAEQRSQFQIGDPTVIAHAGDHCGGEVLVQLDDDPVAQLDELAAQLGTNRSELLRRGATEVGPEQGLPERCVISCDNVITVPIEDLDACRPPR